MKAHKLLWALALVSALPIAAADVVPDVLTLDENLHYWGQAVLSSVDQIEITINPGGGLNGSVRVIDKYAPQDASDPMNERMYQRSYAILPTWEGAPVLKGVLSCRPAGQLATPYFVASTSKLEGLNDINLEWMPVEGADGYELEITDPAENRVTRVTADGTTCKLNGCAYGTAYQFRVRAIHPTDPELSSEFTGRSNFSPQPAYWVYTDGRYEVPEVLKVNSRKEDGFSILFDLTCKDDRYKENFEVVDGKFVADKVRLTEVKETGNVNTEVDLTDADKAAGTKTFSGLTPGAIYYVSLINSSKPKYDAPYNTSAVRIPSEPEEITADQLDEWFATYSSGEPNLYNYLMAMNAGDEGSPSEGAIINLHGDKTYLIPTGIVMKNGFTLRTAPEELAAGKRAVIDATATAPFFLNSPLEIGEIAVSGLVYVGKVAFENIDFIDSEAKNYGDGSVTGNYFINGQSANGYGKEFEGIEMRGCTFKGFIRGFVRIQGNKSLLIDHLIVDNCLFYDCGYFDALGRGYGWFTSPGDVNKNMYNDFQFTNNTIYDSPNQYFLTDNNKVLNWDADTKWNIKMENNTFVNFSTLSSGRYIFNLRFLPAGSKISFQRNLIVLASDDATSMLYSAGADIRSSLTYEVKDNYSVGCRDEHLVNDGIFTSGAFSATKNSFGAFPEGNLGTADDLVVKVGTTPLRATELFTAPNPLAGHKAPANLMEALKYKQTPEVLNHEIYTKGIGDPRWRE